MPSNIRLMHYINSSPVFIQVDGTGADGALGGWERIYQTTPEFMFVSFRLLVVESIRLPEHALICFRFSVRAARIGNSAPLCFYKNDLRSWKHEYQRRHYPDGPKRRRSIHNRPTCPFSADDGAETEEGKGPRMSIVGR